MMTYDIVETDGPLARLLDRVAAGETVTLRRNGRAVARVTPEPQPKKAREPRVKATSKATGSPKAYSAAESLAMIERLAVRPAKPQTPAVELIRRMRDEGP